MTLRFVRWRFALLLRLALLLASPLARAQEASPFTLVHIDQTIIVYRVAPAPDAPHVAAIYFYFKRATYDTAVWRIGAWIAPSAIGTRDTDSARFPAMDTTGYLHIAEPWSMTLPALRSRYRAWLWSGVENQPEQTPPCSTGTTLHPPPAVFDGGENPATFEAVDK